MLFEDFGPRLTRHPLHECNSGGYFASVAPLRSEAAKATRGVDPGKTIVTAERES